MLTSFGGHYTSYSDNVVVEEKLKTLYFDPSTQTHHRITVSYRFNETVPTAIENQLLRSEAYAEWVDKEKILIPMYSKKLDTSTHELWPTVTGLEFCTLEDGNIEWRIFEDTREVVTRIPIADVSYRITNIGSSELMNLKRLTGPVFTAMYKGEKCILKAHEAAYQNKLFRTEFDAQLKLGDAPHILRMIGVVSHDSSLDRKSYVQGLLFQYCGKGDY